MLPWNRKVFFQFFQLICVQSCYFNIQELYKDGKTRAIGVSNFYPDRLVDLIAHNDITPAVNKVETHPFCQQIESHNLMKENNVQIESWGPFAEGKNNMFQNETLVSIAKK